MSLISCIRSSPQLCIVLANFTCFSVRLPSWFSNNCCARIRSEFSGVRSSWDMLARNSDLYLEVRVSCSAFSSSDFLASSTSLFLFSTSSFCFTSRCALSCRSSLVLFSSSARDVDCSSRCSVLEFVSMVFSTIPILSVSCTRKSRCVWLNASNDASSITAFISFSNNTGRIMRLRGVASPSPEDIFT